MKPAKIKLEPEAIYRLGYTEAWGEVIGLLRRHRDRIAQDERLQVAFSQTLEGWFYTDWSGWDPIILNDALEKLYYLHLGGALQLDEAHILTALETLVAWYKTRDPQKAYQLARAYPAHPPFEAVIANQKTGSEKGGGHVYLGRDHRTSLFKSAQEERFFYAVRQVFPSFAVYPNVALSALLDFKGIGPALSGEEAAYFFRAVVDCVVFDQHQRYRPVYFFELDSIYHEDADQQHRDHMKDRILALAGQTLHRIRLDHTPATDDFIIAIRECIPSGER